MGKLKLEGSAFCLQPRRSCHMKGQGFIAATSMSPECRTPGDRPRRGAHESALAHQNPSLETARCLESHARNHTGIRRARIKRRLARGTVCNSQRSAEPSDYSPEDQLVSFVKAGTTECGLDLGEHEPEAQSVAETPEAHPFEAGLSRLLSSFRHSDNRHPCSFLGRPAFLQGIDNCLPSGGAKFSFWLHNFLRF